MTRLTGETISVDKVKILATRAKIITNKTESKAAVRLPFATSFKQLVFLISADIKIPPNVNTTYSEAIFFITNN